MDATSEGMDEDDEANYFDEVVDAQSTTRHGDGGDAMFSELSLSRQLLRGVEAAGCVTIYTIHDIYYVITFLRVFI